MNATGRKMTISDSVVAITGSATTHTVRCWLYQSAEERGHRAPLSAR